MDLINNLALGFGVVFQFVDLKIAFLNITIPFPMNIFLCFVGAMVGTLIGVLPGIGPSPRSRCCCRSHSACRRSAR